MNKEEGRMKKRLITLVLSAIAIFLLAACSTTPEAVDTPEAEEEAPAEAPAERRARNWLGGGGAGGMTPKHPSDSGGDPIATDGGTGEYHRERHEDDE
jgi:hypothetical protein